MTEFESHLEFYKSNYAHQYFSRLIPAEVWGNQKLAEQYLQKYWLSEHEYLSVWKPVQYEIFIEGKVLPDFIYQSEFELIALNGGCLFAEEDFKKLQKAMLNIGEKYFVVIQHSQEYTTGEPMFRMKFPVDITWKELISGNYISAVLLEMSFNNYYVFGDSKNWGKYVANDYLHSIDIVGCKSNVSNIFHKQFRQSVEEQVELRQYLPLAYKDRI